MAATAAQVDLGGVGLLGNAGGEPTRTSTTPLQAVMKGFRWAPAFGGRTDFIQIEGMAPIESISADWSDQLVGTGGLLCPSAPVYFDARNPGGSATWGPAADGALVVAVRGLTDFDVMARNAAESGALGLIVVDNEAKFKNMWCMTKTGEVRPTIPTVMVAQAHGEFMCSGCAGAQASIMRRDPKLGGPKIAKNVMKAATSTSTGPLQAIMKNFRVSPAFGGKTDFIQIEGATPIEGVSADWSDQLVRKGGLLCPSAPVHFDASNPGGSATWGAAANGKLVVAVRGMTDFDVMAHNAAQSGAVGLIIVDNEAKFKNRWCMTKTCEAKPAIPAVMVAQRHGEFLCSGCAGAQASIMRRDPKLGGTKIAKNMMKAAAWPSSEGM